LGAKKTFKSRSKGGSGGFKGSEKSVLSYSKHQHGYIYDFDNSIKTKTWLRVRAAGFTPLRDHLAVTGKYNRLGRVWRDVQRDPPTCAVVELLANSFNCKWDN
jgi:hypothetical protein